MRTVRILLWLPLAAFLIVLALVWGGLIAPQDATIRSQLIEKPVPPFSLPRAGGGPRFTRAALADGHPKLVNLFASWCVPCVAEAPRLLALKRAGVTIIGIDIRDSPADLAAFLKANGNPYAVIAHDDASTLQMALGSSGVPESFLVDGRGVIRLQHVGEIRPRTDSVDRRGDRGRTVRRVALAMVLMATPSWADSNLAPAPLSYTQLSDPQAEARAQALMATIRCVVCQGQSIADSDADLAADMRAMVRQRIAAGEAPEAVRGWLVQRYGKWVSYRPPLDAVTWPLWAAPIVLVALGLMLARATLRRR